MKRSNVLALLLSSTLACASSEQAPAPETTGHVSAATMDDGRADTLFGQPDFGTGAEPTTVSIWTARRPAGLAVGSSGATVFLGIADRGNHRVRALLAPALGPIGLEYHLGQPSYDVGEANAGRATSFDTLSGPTAIAYSVDPSSGLRFAIADTDNHRVLVGFGFSGASWVLGQSSSFTSAERNNGGISSASLAEPKGVGFAGSLGGGFGVQRLWIADSGNHRLLVYTDSSSYRLATWVIGQHRPSDGTDSFTQGAPNDGVGVPRATSLSDPRGLAVVPSDSPSSFRGVWVADTGNHRVLHYSECPAFEGSGRPCPNADFVLGQKDFVTADPSAGGINAFSLDTPTAVALDKQGGVWVADTGHNRVVHFKHGSTKADRVLGQPDFETGAPPTTISESTLSQPTGIAVDATGDLYVADTGANRILRYHFIATPALCDDGDPCTEDSIEAGVCVNGGPLAFSKACFPYLCDTFRRVCNDTCPRGSGSGCQDAYTCTTGGRCALSCSRPDSPCPEGRQCVDGWCCDGACRGTCEACNVSGNEGSCVGVYGAPSNSFGAFSRRVCARADLDDPECAGQCDGFHRAACVPATSSTSCGPETCNDGVATLRGACDGHGKCTFVTQACAPYACAPNGCRTECTAAHHCAIGADCVDGACVGPSDQKIGGVGCSVPQGSAPDGHLSAWGAWSVVLGALAVRSLVRRRRGRR